MKFAEEQPSISPICAHLPAAVNLSPATLAAYENDLRLFKSAGGAVPTDATTIKKYIWGMRDKCRPSTIYRRCMAIRFAHVRLGSASPTDEPQLKSVLRALQLGVVPDKRMLANGFEREARLTCKRRAPKPASPITRRLLTQMLEPLPRGSIDRRDRAILLLGFAGALKRAELVGLNVGDVRFTQDAMLVWAHGVRRGRESGELRELAIPLTGGPLCAASACREWIEKAALDAGNSDDPLFVRFSRGSDPTRERLDAGSVNLIVKKWVAATGVDASTFSAGSLVNGRRLERAKGML
jgi:integrase